MPIDSLFGLQLQQGKIINASSIFKYGRNSDVGTSEETIWDGGGVYSYPTQSTTMSVASSSASDTDQVITVQGLDEDYNLLTQTASLSGTTPQQLATPYIRVFRCFYTSGSEVVGDINVGSGDFSSGVPANLYAKISQGEGQTLMAIYTVPANFTLYIYQGHIGSGTEQLNKFISARLKFRLFNTSQFRTASRLEIQNQAVEFDFGVPQIMPEKTDIEVSALSSSGSNAISADFTGVLIKG